MQNMYNEFTCLMLTITITALVLGAGLIWLIWGAFDATALFAALAIGVALLVVGSIIEQATRG